MNRTIIYFHARSIRDHAKDLVKHLFGIKSVDEDMLERSTAAWHQPRSGPGHPIELCKCACGPDGAEHNEGCAWAAARCRTCVGSGYCPECFGDGTRSDYTPEKPPEDWEHA